MVRGQADTLCPRGNRADSVYRKTSKSSAPGAYESHRARQIRKARHFAGTRSARTWRKPDVGQFRRLRDSALCAGKSTQRKMRSRNGCRFPAVQRRTCRELPCLSTHHPGSSTQGWRDPVRNKAVRSWRADQSVQMWNGCNVSPNWNWSQLGFTLNSAVFAAGKTVGKTFIDAR